VRARKVDVVVVYKVDRLTRSLADFAKLIELFDAHAVSFVSVTQSFNTKTSMGRLTLNICCRSHSLSVRSLANGCGIRLPLPSAREFGSAGRSRSVRMAVQTASSGWNLTSPCHPRRSRWECEAGIAMVRLRGQIVLGNPRPVCPTGRNERPAAVSRTTSNNSVPRRLMADISTHTSISIWAMPVRSLPLLILFRSKLGRI
jgi:hypothetical protein